MGCRSFFSRNVGPTIIAWALLFSISALYLYFVCWDFSRVRSYVIFVIQAIILLHAILNFGRATFMDPGYLPKGIPGEKLLAENSASTRPVMHKLVKINGSVIRLKWCVTCEFYRLPRCSHCSVCKHCIDTFDHHCPWVNNCIGKRNYRFFFLFLVFLTVHMLMTFIVTMFFILERRENLMNAQCIIAIVVLILDGFLLIPVIGLTAFHIYLVSNGLTTNEQVTSKFGDDKSPYNYGICINFYHLACKSVGPKLIRTPVTGAAMQMNLQCQYKDRLKKSDNVSVYDVVVHRKSPISLSENPFREHITNSNRCVLMGDPEGNKIDRTKEGALLIQAPDSPSNYEEREKIRSPTQTYVPANLESKNPQYSPATADINVKNRVDNTDLPQTPTAPSVLHNIQKNSDSTTRGDGKTSIALVERNEMPTVAPSYTSQLTRKEVVGSAAKKIAPPNTSCQTISFDNPPPSSLVHVQKSRTNVYACEHPLALPNPTSLTLPNNTVPCCVAGGYENSRIPIPISKSYQFALSGLPLSNFQKSDSALKILPSLVPPLPPHCAKRSISKLPSQPTSVQFSSQSRDQYISSRSGECGNFYSRTNSNDTAWANTARADPSSNKHFINSQPSKLSAPSVSYAKDTNDQCKIRASAINLRQLNENGNSSHLMECNYSKFRDNSYVSNPSAIIQPYFIPLQSYSQSGSYHTRMNCQNIPQSTANTIYPTPEAQNLISSEESPDGTFEISV